MQPRRRAAVPTPARTSLDEIVAAARHVLEADGLDGLTMRRVADAVGVRAPSLYKRIRSRDDLVRLVVEDAADELTGRLDEAATTGDPRRDLRALADTVRVFARARPVAFALLFAHLPETAQPDPDRLARASDAVLRTTGVLAGPDRALEAARTVVAWAYGFITMEHAGAFRLGGDVDRAFAFGVERLADALTAPDGTALTAPDGTALDGPAPAE